MGTVKVFPLRVLLVPNLKKRPFPSKGKVCMSFFENISSLDMGTVKTPIMAVDGYVSPNPGEGGYRGVCALSGEEIFRNDVGTTTNNIVEFLSIVHALALTKGMETTIYSDSKIAMNWVRDIRCSTAYPFNGELIVRALDFLRSNPLEHLRVEKWKTYRWGENPADPGHKELCGRG